LCLSDPDFWKDVIRPHLPDDCQTTLVELALYLSSHHGMLALPKQRLDSIVDLSKSNSPPAS
ncbi:MAG: hypothetical protein ACJ74Y_03720, partial [Bryobacteraceae bacterium]